MELLLLKLLLKLLLTAEPPKLALLASGAAAGLWGSGRIVASFPAQRKLLHQFL
jgi:hypothetical protein